LEASSSRNVELVIVAGFMSWLNTALTGISVLTPVAPELGDIDNTVGPAGLPGVVLKTTSTQ
jgi:hypothetical protein